MNTPTKEIQEKDYGLKLAEIIPDEIPAAVFTMTTTITVPESFSGPKKFWYVDGVPADRRPIAYDGDGIPRTWQVVFPVHAKKGPYELHVNDVLPRRLDALHDESLSHFEYYYSGAHFFEAYCPKKTLYVTRNLYGAFTSSHKNGTEEYGTRMVLGHAFGGIGLDTTGYGAECFPQKGLPIGEPAKRLTYFMNSAVGKHDIIKEAEKAISKNKIIERSNDIVQAYAVAPRAWRDKNRCHLIEIKNQLASWPMPKTLCDDYIFDMYCVTKQLSSHFDERVLSIMREASDCGLLTNVGLECLVNAENPGTLRWKAAKFKLATALGAEQTAR